MHIFVKCHLLDSFDALATKTQNFSRQVGTERRREISRTGREIFVLSERTPERQLVWIILSESESKLAPIYFFAISVGILTIVTVSCCRFTLILVKRIVWHTNRHWNYDGHERKKNSVDSCDIISGYYYASGVNMPSINAFAMLRGAATCVCKKKLTILVFSSITHPVKIP